MRSLTRTPLNRSKFFRLCLTRVFLGAAMVSLASCGWLPRQGPSGPEMRDAAEKLRSVSIVDVDASVVTTLSNSQEPTLKGAFGDYRPPGEQRIGIGDGVQITLWEAGSGGLFSSPAVDRSSPGTRSAVIPAQVVARDGSITVPFAGRVEVTGRTPPEVERVIVQRLSDKAIDPQALVTVVQNVSNTVTIIRDGGGGARVPLNVRGDRLLEVLASTGGSTPAAMSDVAVQIARDGRTMRVPMAAVLADAQQNIYLRPGDVVTLFHDPQSFSASGALGRNGLVAFDTAALSLDQALAKAGGLQDERADPAGVYVIRFEEQALASRVKPGSEALAVGGKVPTLYHVDLRNPGTIFLSRQFPVRNNDIVYVANASFSDVQKVFNLVNLLLSPAFTAASVQSTVK